MDGVKLSPESSPESVVSSSSRAPVIQIPQSSSSAAPSRQLATQSLSQSNSKKKIVDLDVNSMADETQPELKLEIHIDNSPIRFYNGFQHTMDMINILKKVNITGNINSEIQNALSSLNLDKNSNSKSIECILQNQNAQNTINDFFSDKHQMREIKKFEVLPILDKDKEEAEGAVEDNMNIDLEIKKKPVQGQGQGQGQGQEPVPVQVQESKSEPEGMTNGGAVDIPKTYTKVGSTTPIDINQLHLFTGIDMFDNMHDLKERFEKDVYKKNRCKINDDLLQNFFNLDTISPSVIENNKNQMLKTIINKLKIEDNYIITSRTNDYKTVKRELFSVLDNFTVIVDVDYGKAYELIGKYATDDYVNGNGNGKVSIYKGVEVNYDPAGKKSDADIIAMGCKVLEGKPSIVYEPITNADCDKNNFEYKSIFQRLSTKSNVKLLIDDNNKSSALIEKSDEPGKYILADKTFAEKGDKNSKNYKDLISRFIKFIKRIGDLSVSEPKKFSAEHYLAKRMGDACQAIAALYLPNSILVTYDILLVLFALSIGVKHIIHSHVKVGSEKLLTLYVDKTSHRIDNRFANTYNEVLSYYKIAAVDSSDIQAVLTNNIGEINWNEITTNITKINRMLNAIYDTLQINATSLIKQHSDKVNESSDQIIEYLNSTEFTTQIINTNSDNSNDKYKEFIDSLNKVKLYLHNYFLHKNYMDSIQECINDINKFSHLISDFNSQSTSSSSSSSVSQSPPVDEKNTKEYVENVSKYLSSIKVLQSILNNPVKSFTSIINTNKLNLIKIYKNPSTSQRLKAMICSFNNTEFETNTSYSFLENVFLDLKKYSISVINTSVTDTLLNNKLQSIIATSNSIVLKHGNMLSTRINSLKTQIQAMQPSTGQAMQPSTGQAMQSTSQAMQSTSQAMSSDSESKSSTSQTQRFAGQSKSMKGGGDVKYEIETSLKYIDEIKSYYNDDTSTTYDDNQNHIVYENQEKMMCLFEIYMNYNDLQEKEKIFISNYLTIGQTNYIQEIINFFNTPNVKDNYLKENITDEDKYDNYIEIQNRKKKMKLEPPPFFYNPDGMVFNSGYAHAVEVYGGKRKITRRKRINKKRKHTNKRINKNRKNTKKRINKNRKYTRKH
jgi:hypothetical protein